MFVDNNSSHLQSSAPDPDSLSKWNASVASREDSAKMNSYGKVDLNRSSAVRPESSNESDDDKPLCLKRSTNDFKKTATVTVKKRTFDQTDISNVSKRPNMNAEAVSMPEDDDDDDDEDDVPIAQRLSSNAVTKNSKVTSKVIVKSEKTEAKGRIKIEPRGHVKIEQTTPKKVGGNNATFLDKKKMDSSSKVETSTKKRPLEQPSRLPEKKPKMEEKVQDRKRHVSDEEEDDDDEDDVPICQRTSFIKPTPQTNISNASADEDDGDQEDDDEDDDDEVPMAQRVAKASIAKKTSIVTKKVLDNKKLKIMKGKMILSKKKVVRSSKTVDKGVPGGGGGQKWNTLEHNGVIFPPSYQPHGVKILYNGQPVDLTAEQEEVATMFAVMKDTDYATKETFITNFWKDWKEILGPKHVIKDLKLCDFTPIYEWHLVEKEKKKQMSSEEKKKLKEEKLKLEDKYMWALVDGVKEKVGNFRVEPPGLFRGRGEHPKMGKLKRRIYPENIVINIGKGAPIPECPMPGHKWKEVRHDNTVTWLAYWNDPINTKEFKYVFLHPSSSLKGQSDKEKYEKARTLKEYIDDIRKTYTKNFGSSDSTKKQIAVATYLIDRLALRAGNEKDDDEADTVGCCSLKVEHVALRPPKSLEFDFLGKDSIRYFNTVEVDERVYKAIGDFKKGKQEGDDLFDKLDTNKLNAHLKEIMPGLTAKVFRTYNASITLHNQLKSTSGNNVNEKIAAYQRANKEVAILCNHQRSVPKSHSAQMEKLEGKISELEALVEELKVDLDRAKKGKPPLKDAEGKVKRNQSPEALQKKIDQTNQKIEKMKLDSRIKDDMKTVALGTSKINYMDPRITVAWCKRHEVPIEKIFNKSLLAKFAWAMDVDPDYGF